MARSAQTNKTFQLFGALYMYNSEEKLETPQCAGAVCVVPPSRFAAALSLAITSLPFVR